MVPNYVCCLCALSIDLGPGLGLAGWNIDVVESHNIAVEDGRQESGRIRKPGNGSFIYNDGIFPSRSSRASTVVTLVELFFLKKKISALVYETTQWGLGVKQDSSLQDQESMRKN